MHDGLRLDFTPMIADITECRTNNKGDVCLAVRGFATELIRDTLFKSVATISVFLVDLLTTLETLSVSIISKSYVGRNVYTAAYCLTL